MGFEKRLSEVLNDASHFPRRKNIFALIVLSLLIFSIYSNSLNCSWHFDDWENVGDNPGVQLTRMTWDQIKKALSPNRLNPRTPHRPIATLTFALNYYWGKLNVVGYHLTNILIHLISAIFLYLFLFRTFNLPSQRRRYGSIAYPVAFLATVLWAANPVQTQAVTYIVQRMTSLAGMFYVMGMYFYLKGRTGPERWRNAIFLALCLVAYILAFGSKENAAMLPITLMAFEILVLQEDPGRFLRDNKRMLALVLGGTLLLGLAYLHMKRGGILSFLSGYRERPFTLAERLLTEPRVLLYYISLLLYPVPGRLNISRTIGISTSLLSPISTLISIVVIVGIIVFLLVVSRKHALLCFCGFFFFINHLIESSIFPLELIFEHRNYIPSMLFFVPVTILIWRIFERYASGRAMKMIFSTAIVMLVLSFGHGTYVRNAVWKNEESLWTDAIEKAPNQFRAYNNLGVYYMRMGYWNKAVSAFERGLNRPPMHRTDETLVVLYHLGNLYNERGNPEKAESYYRKILAQNGNFAPALVNLASIYQLRGDKEKADSYLQRAYGASPNDPHINMNMGLYHLHARRPDQAVRHFRKSMRDKRLENRASLYMGIAYKQKKIFGQAIAFLKKSAAMEPKNITPRLYLAEVYWCMGNERSARQEAQKIADIMMKNRSLFGPTMDLILQQGPSGDLSPAILLPLLSDACRGKSAGLDEWIGFMEKILEKEKMIEYDGYHLMSRVPGSKCASN